MLQKQNLVEISNLTIKRISPMQETKIQIQDAFKQNMNDGGSCSESEPFALRTLDDSMEPEFATGCIVIIDPSNAYHDGSYVFAKDNKDEYIFRRLRIMGERYFLEPLNDLYETFEISGPKQIEGIITQRAGTRRSYHKRYD
jgi:SOS-response transcriptional repressor LexA